jgi:hypothetical protein
MIMIELMTVDGKGKDVGLEEFQLCHIVSWRAWSTDDGVKAITCFYTVDRRHKLIKMSIPELKTKINQAENE